MLEKQISIVYVSPFYILGGYFDNEVTSENLLALKTFSDQMEHRKIITFLSINHILFYTTFFILYFKQNCN